MPQDNFVRALDVYVSIYKEFMLPAIICDSDFTAHWYNYAAAKLYSDITGSNVINAFLGEFDKRALFEQIKAEGTIKIEGALFEEMKINLMPMVFENEIAGVIVVLVNAGDIPSTEDGRRVSRTSRLFESNIRDSVEDIFKVMDNTAYKADIVGDGWVKSNLNSISYSSYRILRMAQNLALFTRYRSGESLLNKKTVDLCALLGELKDTSCAVAQQMGINLDFIIPDEICLVAADIQKFQLAFFNILHNSLYFTRADNHVRVSLPSTSEVIKIAVEDNGAGISEEHLPHIFDPFFSKDVNGMQAGVGIGLTLAKIIIENHGGQIRIQSRENAGTLTEISIPRTALSNRISLAGSNAPATYADRFSPVYTGLVDAALSPYNPKHEDYNGR